LNRVAALDPKMANLSGDGILRLSAAQIFSARRARLRLLIVAQTEEVQNVLNQKRAVVLLILNIRRELLE